MEQSFPDYYTLADEIGRGDFYVIKRCIDLRNTVEYAAKIYSLKQLAVKAGNLTEEGIAHEFEICRKLHHPHIVELFNAIKQQDTVYIITELLTGVDVCFEIINKVDEGFVYSELVASHYIQQLLEGVKYLHEHSIVHRGIKPQSVLLASTDENAPVKIVDFGKAVEIPECGYIESERIGASYYMAPEVAKKEKYGLEVDIWGCGVIMYILLGGCLPFYGTSQKTYKAIMEGDYDLSSNTWEYVSDASKELIEYMLTVEPTKRLSAEQALEHPWLGERDKFVERAHLEESVIELRNFNSKRKLKGAVLESMARRNLTNGVFSSVKNSKSSTPQSSFDAPDQKDIDTNGRDILDCMKGVQEVLMDIQATTGGEEDENISFLSCMLENTKLRTMMEIYSSARAATKSLDIQADHKNGEEALYEVSVLLNSFNDMDTECRRLKGILDNPHVKSLVTTHDDVIKELRGKNDTFNNNDGDASTPISSSGVENFTRVRLVQFPKSPDEPMGITLKKTDKKQYLVARIIHGGMVHRQGTLHVGDEIKEINGVNVATCSVERLQQLLRDASGEVTFKIVPGSHNEELENKKLFMKCLFDYDPRGDDLIPCQQAGLPFTCGEILEVVSTSDTHWWQARKGENKQIVGLIPSPELQEKRIRNMALERDKKGGTVTCIMWSKKQKKKSPTRRYSARLNTVFDRLDLVTYEEVVYQEKSSRKSIILIGAHGVGRRHIKNQLVSRFPDKYSYPIPHTSRPPAANEKEGDMWQFERENEMLRDIATHEYLEYGKHDGHLYGTKLSTVRDIMKQKKIPVLDIETPALKLIRCKEFFPYIIFVSSPSTYPGSGDLKMDASLQKLVKDSADLRNRYKHLFDYTIINNTIEETVEQIINHLQQLERSPEWVPAAWYY